jgi:hypothetical protein
MGLAGPPALAVDWNPQPECRLRRLQNEESHIVVIAT